MLFRLQKHDDWTTRVLEFKTCMTYFLFYLQERSTTVSRVTQELTPSVSLNSTFTEGIISPLLHSVHHTLPLQCIITHSNLGEPIILDIIIDIISKL